MDEFNFNDDLKLFSKIIKMREEILFFFININLKSSLLEMNGT